VRPPPFHPDQLVPDSEVGPWRVVASLGAGGFGRVFKVERGGRFYSLKMALRPAGPHASEEEDVDGRLAHEVAALLACAPHPNLPRLHAVDRWPEPPAGYLYFVADYVDGETFHEWRWRVKPTAAHLLSVFTEVVRVVADLHRRGMHHRDLKGDNLLIRREDERPFIIDLGTVRLPGATTLTVGVAPASPHLLPPECVAFLREGTWQHGEHFDAGVPGDLYALGALLYEALTDGYAFDPKLPYDRLLPAIETVAPRAPHVVNPKVPRALGEVAMRLLAKRPEDRYPNTEALLQALWDVAKEKRQPAWKVSLDRPPEADVQVPGPETPRVRMVPELVRTPLDAAPPEPVDVSEEPAESGPTTTPEPQGPAAVGPLETFASTPLQGREDVLPGGRGAAAPELAPVPSRRVSRGAVVGLGVGVLLVLGFVAFGLTRLAPSPGGGAVPAPPPPSEKGIPAMTSHSPSSPDASTLAVVPPSPDAGSVVDAGMQASVPVTEAPAGVAAAPPPKRQSGSSALAKAAAAACVGMACAGSPQLRTSPPEKPCPAKTLKIMKELGFEAPRLIGNVTQISLVPGIGPEFIPVPPDGPVTFYVFDDIEIYGGFIPKGSVLHGQLFRGKDLIFGWVTELVMADGRRFPICGNLVGDQDRDSLGVPYHKASTPERPVMKPRVDISTTPYFGRLP
jgi:serine/threonine-protein kinase